MSFTVKYTNGRGQPMRPKARVKVWQGRSDTSPVVTMMHSAILTKAAAGEDAAGNPLAPLSEDYVRRTGKLRSNLRLTGNMLSTLKVKANKSSGYVRSKAPYAALLHWGSPAKGYPRRQWLAINQDDADRIVREVDKRVMRNAEISLGARKAFMRGAGR